jgi:hypothetical protein
LGEGGFSETPTGTPRNETHVQNAHCHLVAPIWVVFVEYRSCHFSLPEFIDVANEEADETRLAGGSSSTSCAILEAVSTVKVSDWGWLESMSGTGGERERKFSDIRTSARAGRSRQQNYSIILVRKLQKMVGCWCYTGTVEPAVRFLAKRFEPSRFLTISVPGRFGSGTEPNRGTVEPNRTVCIPSTSS